MANYVKFMRGSLTAYRALTEVDTDTLYFLTDPDTSDGWLYLGSKLISGPCSGMTPETLKLTDLMDVAISENVTTDSLLAFNATSGQWENWEFKDLIFQGASATIGGLTGFVPAPKVGEQNYFLRGDGTWAPGCAAHQTFEVAVDDGESHTVAIVRIVGDNIVNDGDLVIVQDLIYGSKYQYTTYVYSNGNWKALDGQYDAENVYFKSDLVFTDPIGSIEIPENGRVTLDTKGKNIKQVMELIFSEERNPEIIAPSVSLDSNCKAYEVGTVITPTYTFSFDKGNYEFGPDTGINPLSYEVIGTNNDVEVEKINGATYPEEEPIMGEMSTSVVVDDATKYCLTVNVRHSTGTIPVTNLNNYYDDGTISAGNATTSSSAITGYRSYFYGVDTGTTSLDGHYIRSELTNGGIYNDQQVITLDASTVPNVKRFIVAIPADSERSGIVSARITSSMYANVIREYKLIDYSVNVGGVNDYNPVPYKVWIYEPASIAETEIHEIILS